MALVMYKDLSLYPSGIRKKGDGIQEKSGQRGIYLRDGFCSKAASFVFIDILQQVRKIESENCGIHGLQGIHGFCGTHSELEESLKNHGDEHTHTGQSAERADDGEQCIDHRVRRHWFGNRHGHPRSSSGKPATTSRSWERGISVFGCLLHS